MIRPRRASRATWEYQSPSSARDSSRGIAAAPLVLGHRGYRAKYPENTLLAFSKAIECGADGVECDIQKSADGRYVVIHDPRVDRVSDGSGEVGSMRMEELRRLDFGGGERIVELAELLSALPADSYLDLELKGETLSPADCALIEDILRSRIRKRRLMISSFQSPLLYHFRRRGYTVGLLIGDEIASRGIGGLMGLLLRLRPRYVNFPVEMVERLGERKARFLLRFLRALGFCILLWTVNDVERARDIIDFADILVTDEVEKILGARPIRRTP
jgi:glycerophosphoryl diester phosphodiesterase